MCKMNKCNRCRKEKDIELFLKPFKIFINYINNEEDTENKEV